MVCGFLLFGLSWYSTLMRIGIVGSRDYPDLNQVREYVKTLPRGTVVVSGGAKGVDTVAEEEAGRRGVKVVVHRAQWQKYGKAAGVIRNRLLVNDCDKIVAFWNDDSPGTKSTIGFASKVGKLLRVFRVGSPKQTTMF